MRLLVPIAMLMLCTPAMAAATLDHKSLEGLPNMSRHAPNFIASGRLGADDIGALLQAGIEVVIDLSDDEETPDFDEAAAVSEAGMRYSNLPIDGASGLTRENVERFDELVTASGNAPTLIHCGSSNRVGALIALRAATLHGKSTEDAIALGTSWGLKGLEPAVREQLAKSETERTVAKEPSRPPLLFPRIVAGGGVYALDGAAALPATGVMHRVVIDATTGDVNDAGQNRRIEAAARAVNLYAMAKVPADRLKLAVVIHGKTTPSVLTDSAYQARFGSPNPNSALFAALHEAGVEFYLCGQSMVHAGYARDEVRSEVQVALSAMTTLADLQTSGYALIP
ncbi:DsrE family protein [Dokdonella sp.]|uniref:DsrE family protein n=1 Tax=Dokdonella sp. TaxID=2291710 RepID=UPI0035279C90